MPARALGRAAQARRPRARADARARRSSSTTSRRAASIRSRAAWSTSSIEETREPLRRDQRRHLARHGEHVPHRAPGVPRGRGARSIAHGHARRARARRQRGGAASSSGQRRRHRAASAGSTSSRRRCRGRATARTGAAPAPARLDAPSGRGDAAADMTNAVLKAAIEEAQGKPGEGGFVDLPEGRRITLHAAHGGVGLTVTKVERIATGAAWSARGTSAARCSCSRWRTCSRSASRATAAAPRARRARLDSLAERPAEVVLGRARPIVLGFGVGARRVDMVGGTS